MSTQVQLSQGFLDALTSLKLTATTLGTGVTVDQTFSFPVTGGNIDYYDPADQPEKMLDGTVEHVGSGISLRSGDTVVDLTDIRIDPGVSRLFATVSANGEVVADDVFVFRLDNSTFAPITENAEGDAVLAGGTVYVSPDAAALLRETFKSGEISEDLAIGSATFTLRAAPQE